MSSNRVATSVRGSRNGESAMREMSSGALRKRRYHSSGLGRLITGHDRLLMYPRISACHSELRYRPSLVWKSSGDVAIPEKRASTPSIWSNPIVPFPDSRVPDDSPSLSSQLIRSPGNNRPSGRYTTSRPRLARYRLTSRQQTSSSRPMTKMHPTHALVSPTAAGQSGRQSTCESATRKVRSGLPAHPRTFSGRQMCGGPKFLAQVDR